MGTDEGVCPYLLIRGNGEYVIKKYVYMAFCLKALFAWFETICSMSAVRYSLYRLEGLRFYWCLYISPCFVSMKRTWKILSICRPTSAVLFPFDRNTWSSSTSGVMKLGIWGMILSLGIFSIPKECRAEILICSHPNSDSFLNRIRKSKKNLWSLQSLMECSCRYLKENKG